jgi:ALIX V-shaped domain binding to HIV
LHASLRRYVDTFRSEIQNVVTQTEWLVDQKTAAARQALAAVSLPHSLTAYRQQQAGGGLPTELWQRIASLQRDRTVERVLDELSQVRHAADVARATFARIEDQLEEDLEVNGLFRQKHPPFEGHDVTVIQKPFRLALQNYQRLMVSARESDDLLIRRCEVLETDPKFRLLRLQRAQLDRLVPARTTHNGPAEADVTALSNLLVELSSLFHERESLRHDLNEQAKTYNIAEDLSSIGPQASAEDYRQVVERAKSSFHGLVEDMRVNLEAQTSLLARILAENEQFVRDRDASRHSTSDPSATADLDDTSPLLRMTDALDEIDEVAQHLQEGRTFYDVVIPKLEKLQEQVEDVSGRLKQERCDYEEYVRRPQRPEPTTSMPASSSRTMGQSGGSGARTTSSSLRPELPYESAPPPTLARPGRPTSNNNTSASLRGTAEQQQQQPLPQRENVVRVDDEKFANLVAMDFDPERVVAALKKHSNDFEQALNDLLSF